jgi:hypothetical protein
LAPPTDGLLSSLVCFAIPPTPKKDLAFLWRKHRLPRLDLPPNAFCAPFHCSLSTLFTMTCQTRGLGSILKNRFPHLGVPLCLLPSVRTLGCRKDIMAVSCSATAYPFLRYRLKSFGSRLGSVPSSPRVAVVASP